MEELKLNTIEEAIADFREGKFVIVVDDEDRENEGDLIVAAEKITPEQVNFMLKHARGVLCVPITISRCKELELPHQVDTNTSVLGTPFTVTVDKLEGCSTGVSIHDRAATIRALADPTSTPETFGRPGHVNPLYAQDKGVLRRAGHTEACIGIRKICMDMGMTNKEDFYCFYTFRHTWATIAQNDCNANLYFIITTVDIHTGNQS